MPPKWNYPSSVINQKEKDVNSFSFTDSCAFLLSQLTNVDISRIKACKVQSRSLPLYLPWYLARKGGGAITLGNKQKSRIIFTENFFSINQDFYGQAAYGNNTSVWLRMAVHEVMHIQHGVRFGYLFIYILTFLWQYFRFGHDKAPLEGEAEIGVRNYERFNRFLGIKFNTSCAQILDSELPEDHKLELFNNYWSVYNQNA